MPEPSDEEAHICNIRLKRDVNGVPQMTTEDGEIFTDKTIVEFRYELDNILEELINIIICNKCNNPEIKFNKEKKKLFKSCAACGNSIEILDDFKKMLINEG